MAGLALPQPLDLAASGLTFTVALSYNSPPDAQVTSVTLDHHGHRLGDKVAADKSKHIILLPRLVVRFPSF